MDKVKTLTIQIGKCVKFLLWILWIIKLLLYTVVHHFQPVEM